MDKTFEVEVEKEVLEGEVIRDELAEMEENPLIIRLDKPFSFEGKEYTHIDLTLLEELTGIQLINIGKRFKKSGGDAIVPEMDTEYAVFVAQEVCKLPVEFFRRLPSRELVKIRMKVMGFYFQGA